MSEQEQAELERYLAELSAEAAADEAAELASLDRLAELVRESEEAQ